MLELVRRHFYFTVPSVIAGLGYIALAWFVPREDTFILLSVFFLLFAISWFQFEKAESPMEMSILLKAAFIFRIIFLFSIPMLSDDYFRFIWDGRLVAHGINPFHLTPAGFNGTEAAGTIGLTPGLFRELNSPGYYSIYPPVLQFVFGIAAKLFPGSIAGSVIVMRIFILLAELGTIWLIRQLIDTFGLAKKNVLLYALNPLVIVELTGNIHFEAFLVFFLLLAVYLLVKGRLLFSVIAFSFAVCSKLLPLMFLPILIRFLGWKKAMLYSVLVLIFIAFLFIPFADKTSIQNFIASTNLYFQKFEFNAGLFYLVRWIGMETIGYDVIQTVGPLFGGIVLLFVMVLSFWPGRNQHSDLPRIMLIVLTIYFLLASIVHPWYITTLVAMSLFTHLRYPMVWSALAVLSYVTYQNSVYEESVIVLLVEYGITLSFLIYEARRAISDKRIGILIRG